MGIGLFFGVWPARMRDRDQHDVHDADPADQETDGGDPRQQERECRPRFGLRHEELRAILNAEVITPVVAMAW